MNLGLEGRRVLVGGATGGLGSAIATAMAAEGARLLLWARDDQRLDELAERLRATGTDVATVSADATSPVAPAIVLDAVERRLGGVDVLVLNAGGPPPVDPLETDAEDWQSALQLLVLTPVAIATALTPGMRAQRWGRIVAVLSSGILEPIPNLVYSNAGRSALASWLKTAASPLAADGVTVNGVVPGRIATARTAALDAARATTSGSTSDDVRRASEATIPVGRYGDPAEFAAAVCFLASDAAGYQTGGLTRVDGGLVRSL